jgi:glycosyltransferase involved in cell wall biosynthesis
VNEGDRRLGLSEFAPIRVLALMEASTVAGPAGNLIDAARWAREPHPDAPATEICIVSYVRSGSGSGESFIAASREAGLPTEVISEEHRFDLGVISRIRGIIARRRPHIIQTHNVKSHLLIRLMKAWRAHPWLVFQHGYTNKGLKDRIYNQFDRWTLRKAFRVVSVCQAFSARLEGWGVPATRIRVLHNPARPYLSPGSSEVEAVRKELDLEPGTFVVLSVGRLSREKGHRDLLEAAAILRDSNPAVPIRFVVVGDGPEREALAVRSERLGLRSVVTLAGQRRDVRPFYALANALALPSHSEGSPNVVLEAMAAGVPVVATAVGGVPEIVTDCVTGLVVSSRKPAAMASALGRVISDEELRRRLAAAGKEYVSSKHSQAEYCRSLIAIYQEAIGAFYGGQG